MNSSHKTSLLFLFWLLLVFSQKPASASMYLYAYDVYPATGLFCDTGTRLIYFSTAEGGNEQIKSMKVLRVINSDIDTFYWTGLLDSFCATTIINFGKYTFTDVTKPYTIKLKFLEVNGKAFNTTSNFDISRTIHIGLKGTIIVDTSAHSIADYRSLADVGNDMSRYGVCGAVTVKVADGTYDQVELDHVKGTSASQRITFESLSGDSSKTTITSIYHQGTAMALSGVSFITIRKLTITNIGYSAIGFGDSCSDMVLENNKIICKGNNFDAIYLGYTTLSVSDTIRNNEIIGGYNGIEFSYNYGSGWPRSKIIYTRNRGNAVYNNYVHDLAVGGLWPASRSTH